MSGAKKRAALVSLMLCIVATAGCRRIEESTLLTGWVTRSSLFEAEPVYKSDYLGYQPNAAALGIIKNFAYDLQFMVFLGTWCPDCAREVPKFLKTVDLASNPRLTFKMLALDRSKKDSEGVAERFRIERIPTFILLTGGREVGRIVERVEMSIEEDISSILLEAEAQYRHELERQTRQ